MKIMIENNMVSISNFNKKELIKGLVTYIKTLKNLGISIEEIYLATKKGFEYEREITNSKIKDLLEVLGLEE